MRARALFLGLMALASLAASVGDAAPRRRIAIIAPPSTPAASGLRGSQPLASAPAKGAASRPAIAPPMALALRQSQASPGVSSDGGGQCRLTCAHSYYFCLSGEDAPSCPGSWTSCLADCSRAPIAP
jgi:hypothetical protein